MGFEGETNRTQTHAPFGKSAYDKLRRSLGQAGERLGDAWSAHKERAQRNHRSLPHGAAPMLWVWFLVFVAAAALLGSTWMLLVFIAGSVGHVDWTFDWRNGSDGVRRANWSAEANVHALIGVGLFLASAAVAAFNAVWLHVRTHLTGIFRNVVTGIGALVALFMISGAIVVQQWGTDDRTRDEVAATQTAQAGVAAIDAEIAGINDDWTRQCSDRLTTYQAQACRSGEAAWRQRMAIAATQTDANSRAQVPFIQRAIADAVHGDQMRARLQQLRAQRAAAAVTTVQASVQSVRADGWFAVFSHTLEDLRKPFIAVLGELLAMTMFGVALAALRSRQQLVETSGWADEGHRIEDHSHEEPLPADPAGVRMQTVMREENLETGEVKVQVTPKPHWRTVKKGKPKKIEIPPDVQPDEVGVPAGLDHGDGGLRSAALHGEHEPVSPPSDGVPPATAINVDSGADEAGDLPHDKNDERAKEESVAIDAHPEISDEDALAAYEAEGELAEGRDEPESNTLASKDELSEPVDAEPTAEASPVEPASYSTENEADDDMQHDSPMPMQQPPEPGGEEPTEVHHEPSHEPITDESRLLEPAK